MPEVKPPLVERALIYLLAGLFLISAGVNLLWLLTSAPQLVAYLDL